MQVEAALLKTVCGMSYTRTLNKVEILHSIRINPSNTYLMGLYIGVMGIQGVQNY